MKRATASLDTRLSWEDVLDAAARREGERSFLSRLVLYLCQQHEIEAAALYARGESGYERLVSVGSEAFPAVIGEQEEVGYPTVL